MIEYVGGAWLYDKMYGFKDYEAEAARLMEIIGENMDRKPSSLLDVACGTGMHLQAVAPHFDELAGVDITEDFLRAAKERVPQAHLVHGDMRSFEVGRQFDVVTILFSAIGYSATTEGLNETIVQMALHTLPGGVVIVEPWLSPDKFIEGHIHLLAVDEPQLKIARMNNSRREGNLTSFVFYYLIGTPDKIEHFTENHTLMMFTDEEYREAFARAGLEAVHDEEGLIGRGLYIGRKH